MTEQPVNLPAAIYLGVFSRAEQRVLQATSRQLRKMAADVSLPSRGSPATRTPANQPRAMRSPKRFAVGLLKKTERRSCCAVSLPNILSYGLMGSHGADVDMYVRGSNYRTP